MERGGIAGCKETRGRRRVGVIWFQATREREAGRKEVGHAIRGADTEGRKSKRRGVGE